MPENMAHHGFWNQLWLHELQSMVVPPYPPMERHHHMPPKFLQTWSNTKIGPSFLNPRANLLYIYISCCQLRDRPKHKQLPTLWLINTISKLMVGLFWVHHGKFLHLAAFRLQTITLYKGSKVAGPRHSSHLNVARRSRFTSRPGRA